MAYASKAGRAYANARNPQAQGVCDRCGIWYQARRLQWQYDVRGFELQNLHLLVCDRCLDKPFIPNIPVVIPPDPVPLMNARPDTYALFLDGPTTLLDSNFEPILDTNGAPILATPSGTQNVPPYPFAGFTMLRADGGGGRVQQIVVRDDAYAQLARQGVQAFGPGGVPLFNSTPAQNPNYPYNNKNNLTNNSGQVPNEYAFPVILDVDD